MHDKQAPGEWAVYDSAARQEDPEKRGQIIPRMHESRPGRPWALRYNVPCYMPQNDARVFLKDPSFIVHDDEGNLVPGLAAEALLRRAPTELAPNLVIADLAELTTDALLTRATQRTDGQKLNQATPRGVLIQFLTDGYEAGPGDDVPAPGRPRPRRDADELDDSTASRMLEGA